MNSFITTLCTFSALIATAYGGCCHHCHERNSTTCATESKDCGGESRCIVISEYYESCGKIYNSIYKGCAKELPCDQMMSTSDDAGEHVRMNYKCCTGDDCNTDNYEIPPDSGEPSGVICPSCYELDTREECVTKRDMVCKGDEMKCKNYIGIIKKPDAEELQFSVKGCASSLACTMGFSAMIGVEEISSINYECK
ncbi:hypothetical protein FKM82_013006 [Ascaphus truei]|uniref:phospholipase A2 inhibitor LNF1-like n=1 Tax=Ascaphus truei TaxID=8439 RepID=UPI003F5A3CDE